MLTRSSQIGEFYVMQPPQVQPEGTGKYTADMMIYDEESDRHVRIPWWEALAASGAGELFAGGSGSTTLAGRTTNNSLGNWLDAACKIAAYSSGMYITVAADGKISAATAGTATTTGSLAAGTAFVYGPPDVSDAAKAAAAFEALDKGIRIVVARPFIEHLMHSVILTVSGRDTGATCAILR